VFIACVYYQSIKRALKIKIYLQQNKKKWRGVKSILLQQNKKRREPGKNVTLVVYLQQIVAR
jgi:hypothetical protein